MSTLHRILLAVWPPYRRRQEAIAWLILEGWEPGKLISGFANFMAVTKDGAYCTTYYNENEGRIKNALHPIAPCSWSSIGARDANRLRDLVASRRLKGLK
jgi:hypothetical protein